jgi:lysyl-tRNA synthetase class I
VSLAELLAWAELTQKIQNRATAFRYTILNRCAVDDREFFANTYAASDKDFKAAEKAGQLHTPFYRMAELASVVKDAQSQAQQILTKAQEDAQAIADAATEQAQQMADSYNAKLAQLEADYQAKEQTLSQNLAGRIQQLVAQEMAKTLGGPQGA